MTPDPMWVVTRKNMDVLHFEFINIFIKLTYNILVYNGCILIVRWLYTNCILVYN